MDENNRTDKELLKKGLQQLGITVLLMFAGPSLFRIAMLNQEKNLYIPILIVSILIILLAIVMFFIALRTIVNSFFDKS
ncbi:MAG: hypothetical protein HRU50_15665 [Winogradskyella sp.]|uniref:DUF6095 family protein n=1 Tax=Winogradskyella sp. TaxID=1883156 RepID=UPI0025F17594|nr:DUF6095 family protein [Winogradskyella sp.]NRB61360.1 hypothetical protein [Winogradskyella sp.]